MQANLEWRPWSIDAMEHEIQWPSKARSITSGDHADFSAMQIALVHPFAQYLCQSGNAEFLAFLNQKADEILTYLAGMESRVKSQPEQSSQL